jgi:hypothetical protein
MLLLVRAHHDHLAWRLRHATEPVTDRGVGTIE